MSSSEENINDRLYKQFFQFQGRSQWMESIWQDAFGDQFPKNLHHYGYITTIELEKMIALLDLEPDHVFLDIGCGKGGPGLYIAQQTGARYLGIDKVNEAVLQAKKFASQFDLNQEALFHQGEFYNIPLDDEMVDSVISIDSFWAAADKSFALQEVGRVLKPAGSFVFTNWDLLDQDPVHLYEQAGFKVIHREESKSWKVFQQKVYEGIIRYEKELLSEMGKAAEMLIYEANASLPYLGLSVRRLNHLVKK